MGKFKVPLPRGEGFRVRAIIFAKTEILSQIQICREFNQGGFTRLCMMVAQWDQKENRIERNKINSPRSVR
jgi:hypothetical protein